MSLGEIPLHYLRHIHVRELHASQILGDQHVGAFEISVDYLAFMHLLQGHCELVEYGDNLLLRESPVFFSHFSNQTLQIPPRHILHHQVEMLLSLIDEGFLVLYDVRALKRGQDSYFIERVLEVFALERLERNLLQGIYSASVLSPNFEDTCKGSLSEDLERFELLFGDSTVLGAIQISTFH